MMVIRFSQTRNRSRQSVVVPESMKMGVAVRDFLGGEPPDERLVHLVEAGADGGRGPRPRGRLAVTAAVYL